MLCGVAEPDDQVDDVLELEMVAIDKLTPHPRNAWTHPDDEVDHLAQSIAQHSLYRNVVVARDGTILAGHGVVQAARKLGRKRVPVRRLDLDPDSPQALKLLAGDNTIAHLAVVDDRELSEILRLVQQDDVAGLLGTGYDELMLANLVYITRAATEIPNVDQAAQWVGMPEYDAGEHPLKLTMAFRTADDRIRFLALLGLTEPPRGEKQILWPALPHDDVLSVRFQGPA
jgi:ParB/Sulfiredoxin domain